MFCVRRWTSLRRVIQPSALRSTVPSFICKPRWMASLSKAGGSLPREPEHAHVRLNMMRSISTRCHNIWRNRYKRFTVAGLGILGTSLYYASLDEVPVTGRKRCNILPKKLMVTVGQYGTEGWLEDHQEQNGHLLHVSDERFAMTKRVMKKITRANGLNDEDWRVYIFDDDSERASHSKEAI
ncbi:hypothetical protein NQ176_g5239 [Zarea fungicola]|uniref:Uncharacterized protein n=1 Tax=Zarea fungicola TaxID=93591 RepID=A0ACC1NBV5_9HYPO|nr:hypothetical protein NQ176_g5239 [Lecanicillium fungicola]